MSRPLCLLCLSSLGCQREPPLISVVAGHWEGYVDAGEGAWESDASFWMDEDEEYLSGWVRVRSEPQRFYDLLEATEVEIGISFAFIERGGVREMFLDALEPFDPFYGAFRSRWFCEGEPDGFCHQDGIFQY
jgi:hypothetical protein